jgi:hypothetical protein
MVSPPMGAWSRKPSRWRGPTRCVATLALLAGGVRGRVAAAQTADERSGLPLRLTVDAPAGCPDSAALLVQVKEYSTRVRDASPGEPAQTIHVEMRPSDGQFLGTLTLRNVDGEEGRREVRDVDCASVAAAMAFVVAVVVDPNVARMANPRAAARTAPPSPVLPLPPGSSPPASHGPPPRFAAGAAIAGIEGLGRGIQISPRVFVDLELPGPLERFDARASLGRAFTTSAPAPPFGTARITLTDVRFEPCFAAWSSRSFRLGACGVVDIASLNGQGIDTTASANATRRSVELGGGLRPTWIVADRVTIGLLAGATAATARFRFYFSPDATAYELARWSGFVEFGVGVYFW